MWYTSLPIKVTLTFDLSRYKILQHVIVNRFIKNIIGCCYVAIGIIIVNPLARTFNNKTSNGLCRSLLAFYWSNYKQTIKVSLD